MPEVTVECPLCGKVIEITVYNAIGRGDALLKHLDEECIVNRGLPTSPAVGPPLPKALGIKWPWRGR